MSIDLKNLEITYKKLYEISVQIGQLIERELYSDLLGFIERKDQLLAESAELLDKANAHRENTAHLHELFTKFAEQEKLNIEALSRIRDKIEDELHKISADKKIVGAYAAPEEKHQGNILDFRE